MIDYTALKKRHAYEGELIKARAVLDAQKAQEQAEAEKTPDVPVDLDAQKTAARNMVVCAALGTDKANILGTLTTLPTLTAKALAAEAAIDEVDAEILIAEGVKLHTEAMALKPLGVIEKPLEK